MLEETDERFGSHLVRVFDVATGVFPWLSETILIPSEELLSYTDGRLDVGPHPQTIFRKEGGGVITFSSTDEDLYKLFINGHFKGRVTAHKDIVRAAKGHVHPADILTICVAHELGHVKDVIPMQEKMGIDAALSRYSQELQEDLWSLPLALPSPEAVINWEENKGGYQTCLRNAGYDTKTFFECVEENAQAYGGLRHEASADEFALDVITSVYGGLKAA